MRRHKVFALAVATVALASATVHAGPTFTSVLINPVAEEDVPEFASEPGIAVDPTNDSNLWVVAPDGIATLVWRSTDAGLTWSRPPSPAGGGGDSDVVIDAAGTVYVSDLVNEDVDSTIPVSRWNGTGWDTPAVELAPSASGVEWDRQWMAAKEAGHVVVVARRDDKYDFWESTDWETGFTLTSNIATGVDTGGTITFAPDGTLYTVFSSADGKIRYAKRPPSGAWTVGDVFDLPVGTPSADFPVIDVDAAGNLYAAWSELRGSILGFGLQSLVFMSFSTDGGSTWSAPRLVSSEAKTAVFPWIAAGAAGKVNVLFVQADDDVPADIGTPTTRWDVVVSQSRNALGATPLYESVIVADDFHTGSICTQGTLCLGPQSLFGVGNAPTPLDRRHLDFFEMAVDSTGRAYVSYTRDRAILAEDNSITVGDLFLSWLDLLVARQTGGDLLG